MTRLQSMRMTTSSTLSTRAPQTAIMIQKFDGSTAFDKSWAEFKGGFGDVGGNYWLGNDKISELTLGGCNELTFVVQV